MATELNTEQAWAWRMRRHGLVERAAPAQLLDVASTTCGLHAQVMSSAELTAWARIEGLEPDAVSRALWEDRTLVKTWAMRGTLHLLPTSELELWLGATGTYRHYLKPAWFKAFEITAPELEELIEAVSEALGEGPVTRAELAAAVAERTRKPGLGAKLAESWGVYLKPVAFRGRLCFAPSAGQNVRFARPDAWLGREIVPADGAEALRELARRWLGACGPAGREDLVSWFRGHTPAQAGKLIASLGDDVSEVEVEGTRLWMLAEDARRAAASEPSRALALLPGFDQYVVGAPRKGPTAPLDPRHKGRVYRKAGWISAVILIDGRIAGVWRHERKGARLNVELEPFEKLSRWAKAAAEAEAHRLAGFLGGEPAVTWTG